MSRIPRLFMSIHFPSRPLMTLGWYLLVANILSRWVVLSTNAHVAAWTKGMYCINGTQAGVNDQNTNDAVQPLYMLNKTDWWFHHNNKCDLFPPAPGDFLELPANGEFTVEHAVNRAFTTLSNYGGSNIADFGDGQNHPGFGTTLDGKETLDGCITNPNIHTQNQSMAAGTVFAISYTSDLSKVTEENLVVFTVLYHTPWKRLATYQVPDLPACPDAGCICAWGWVANGCGIPNMYMLPYRCRVVGNTGEAAVAPGVPPAWCEDDQTKCVQGPKQMVFWNQLEGNNVNVDGYDLAGDPKSPTYNAKMGFSDGAQNDIFLSAGTVPTTSIPPAGTPTLSPAPSGSAHSGSSRNVPYAFAIFGLPLGLFISFGSLPV